MWTPFGQLRRFLAASRWHRPDRGVVTFLLLVHGHAHKRDPRSIRRNLRIADPDKIPQIFFGDVSLLSRESAGRCEENQERGKKCAHRFINDEALMTNDEGM